MRFLFIVQGEGRGHMTQAISLQDILIRNGHEVVEVLVGKSPRREIPAFFYEKIKCDIKSYESPNFVMSKDNKSLLLFQSVSYNLKKFNTFIRSMKFISARVKETRADVVINYYELLAGFTSLIFNLKVPVYCIGHQYLLLHPRFVFPEGKRFDKWLLNLNTRLTSFRARKFLALSFVEMPDVPVKKVYVVPPLLRREVLEAQTSDKNYILGYMLNSGYAEEIISWHKRHPEIVVHFFWDKKDAPEDLEVHPNLYFHKISDVKFLNYMKDCSAFSSTAGFESVCEAFYLQKPLMMVPTGNHYEQNCNAFDANRAGAGVFDFEFNLDLLLDLKTKYRKTDVFRLWVRQAENKFIKILTETEEMK
ncbi:MAG TPA: glycosyltransferase family protein [Bacteroidales bacterium]|nr:glycosyltransferase family protein [Bacteroidales bacterium]